MFGLAILLTCVRYPLSHRLRCLHMLTGTGDRVLESSVFVLGAVESFGAQGQPASRLLRVAFSHASSPAVSNWEVGHVLA